MDTMVDLKDLLKHQIEDLFSAEEQIIEALPEMIESSSHPELKKALNQHLAITKKQKTKLEKIQEMLGEEPSSEKSKGLFAGLFGNGKEVCKGMKGLIDEGEKTMEGDMTSDVMDAAIIACAQKIEHYEISGYGTARAYAMELGLNKIAKMLEEIRDEEYMADELLTRLALRKINKDAENAGEEDDKEPGRRTRATSSSNGRSKSSSKKTSSSNGSKAKTAVKKTQCYFNVEENESGEIQGKI